MKLSWTVFSGIRPKADPRLLPTGNAQKAENVDTARGGLRPLAGVKDIAPLSKIGVKTIYRFGQALHDPDKFWFHWTMDVDVVKGPINDDTAERTYWTGDGAPKYTTNQLGTGGANLPAAARPLGVPAPAVAPTLAATGTSATGASTETRVYVYTLVSVDGAESAPSPPATVAMTVGQSIVLSNMATTAENAIPLSAKRIYRAQRGVYLFVSEVPATQTSFQDSLASDSLGQACPSIEWDTPPAEMFGLTAGPNGMMAALDGYTVRLCEPFRPHAWPMSYAQTVGYPCVGLGQFGQSFVVLTTGFPFVLTGSHPKNVSMAPAKFYQPCLSKRSIVSTGGDVIWASPDGLVSIGASGEQNLTEGIFTPEQWRALKPETLIGEWHEGCYIGSYDAGNGRAAFRFRPASQEWVDIPQLAITAMYRDTVGDALYVCVNDRIQQFMAGEPAAFLWKSQQVVTPLMDFVAARVTGSYPVTFKLYKKGVVAKTKVIDSDEPFKLPPGLCRDWAVEVMGAKEVLGIVLSTSEVDI